jgi:hypothetical protein
MEETPQESRYTLMLIGIFIAFFQAGFQKLKNDPEANHKILMLRNSFSLKG